MLTTIFTIWLYGFLVTETVYVTQTLVDPPTRVMTTGEAVALNTIGAVAWPATVPLGIYFKISELRSK